MAIQVKFAETAAEKEAVYQLRYEIYIEELGVRMPHQDGQLKDINDEWARILIAYDEEELVGTLRILWGRDHSLPATHSEIYDLARFDSVVTQDQIVIFERFAVKPKYRGTQAPFQLLGAISMFALENKVQLAFCDAKPHLLNLYLGLGFRTYTSTFSTDDDGILIPLIFVCEDIDYLRKIGSPLLGFGRGITFDSDVPEKIGPLISQGEAILESATDANIADWIQSYDLLTRTGTTKISLFQDMNDADVAKLLAYSQIIDCKPGDFIITADGKLRSMYLILSGSVEIRSGSEVTSIRTEGDVVGELAFLLNGRRTANVVAVGDNVRVLSLREKTILKLQKEEPALAAQLMYNLARIVALKMTSLYQKTYS